MHFDDKDIIEKHKKQLVHVFFEDMFRIKEEDLILPKNYVLANTEGGAREALLAPRLHFYFCRHYNRVLPIDICKKSGILNTH